MVFTQLLENITDLFSGKTKNENNRKNEIPLNQLSQGLTYLQNKQNRFNEINNKSSLLEQFDTSALDETTQNELQVLDMLKEEYNQKLSQYSTSYKGFMENYYKATQDVISCKADCENKHKPLVLLNGVIVNLHAKQGVILRDHMYLNVKVTIKVIMVKNAIV